jgi:hypothetical protein
MQFREQIEQLLNCKVSGICQRDKLVSEWVRLRIASNNEVRLATVDKLRINWELQCPVTCGEDNE